MKLTTVAYTASTEYYSDSRESITLSAELEDGDKYEDVLAQLKLKVHSQLNDLSKYHKAQEKIYKAENKLGDLKENYESGWY